MQISADVSVISHTELAGRERAATSCETVDAKDEPAISRMSSSRLSIMSTRVAGCLLLCAMLPVTVAQSVPTCTPVEHKKSKAMTGGEAALIPILVLVSGVLAGLTLGYLMLDSTTLTVLQKSGTPTQQIQARKILPIRKNGHLLLVTLLLANLIVQEALPVIAENVLGSGITAVVISTVLVVIFSEIIPQSVCSRYGLAIGAFMVWPVRCLIYLFFPVAWPVSKLLQWLLGEHSGVVYKRAELKELVAMHAEGSGQGDLEKDTVAIVAGALDFQIKSVGDAMTPIASTFMLNRHTTKLDYETLGKVLQSGHSRIPVYEDVDVKSADGEVVSKRIVGVILTKQFILLDPEDGVPLRDLPLHNMPTVPDNLPLHSMLNIFQEGRTHIAVVAPLLPQFRPRQDSTSSGSDESKAEEEGKSKRRRLKKMFRRDSNSSEDSVSKVEEGKAASIKLHDFNDLADAQGSQLDLLSAMADCDRPIGIITLEDVLEELIGEEILDELDIGPEGKSSLMPYIPAEYYTQIVKQRMPVEKPEKIKSTGRPSFGPLFSTRALTKVDLVEKAQPALKGSKAEEKTLDEKQASDSLPPPKPKAVTILGGLLPARSRSTPARSRSTNVPSVSSTPPTGPIQTSDSTFTREPEIIGPPSSPLYLVPERTLSSASLETPKEPTSLPPMRRASLTEGTDRHSSAPPNPDVRRPSVPESTLDRGRRQAIKLASAQSMANSSPTPQQLLFGHVPATPASSSAGSARRQIFKHQDSATPRSATPNITVESPVQPE